MDQVAVGRLRKWMRLVQIAGVVLLVAMGGAAVYMWRLMERTQRELTFERGWQAYQQGDLPGMQEALTKIEKDAEMGEKAKLLKGGMMVRQQHYDQALRFLGEAPEEGKATKRDLWVRGEASFFLGQFGVAGGYFQRMVKEFPKEVEGYRFLAGVKYEQGALDDAMGLLDQGLEHSPKDRLTLRLKGMIQMQMEQYEGAREAFAGALEADPPPLARQELVRLLGRALVKLKRFEEAKQVLQQVDPDVTSLSMIAESEWSLGEKEAAKKTLDRAEGLMKEHPDLLRIRAKVLSDEGKWEEAEKVLRKWILVDPEESESRYQLVQVLQRNGKKEAAEEEQKNYEKVMELRVRLNELTKVASLNPDDAEVRDELARVHDQLGGTTMAELWRQAAAAVRGQKKKSGEKVSSEKEGDAPRKEEEQGAESKSVESAK